MKLSELVLAIGDDNIGLQNLDACASRLDMTKHGTKVTFGTDQPLDRRGTVKMGLVVWLDRARVAEVMATAASDPLEHLSDGMEAPGA